MLNGIHTYHAPIEWEIRHLASTFVCPDCPAQHFDAGFLESLAEELSHPEDPLSCAAGLQLVTQLAQQSGPAAIGFLGRDLLDNLRRLVTGEDAFLKSSALQVLARRLSSNNCHGLTVVRRVIKCSRIQNNLFGSMFSDHIMMSFEHLSTLTRVRVWH